MSYAYDELINWQEQCVNWDHCNVELEVQTIKVCHRSKLMFNVQLILALTQLLWNSLITNCKHKKLWWKQIITKIIFP